MDLVRRSWRLLQATRLYGCPQVFSSTKSKKSVYEYRRKWVTDEKWPINRFTGRPWAPNVPMEQNINLWSRENAYFGAYDFMDILGNDLTLDPNLLCKGPSYMRGQKLNELQRLVKRREMHGTKMHSESLQQMEKRIHYLLKRANRVKMKRTRHHKLSPKDIPINRGERFE